MNDLVTWSYDRKSFTCPDVVGLFSALKEHRGFSDEHIHFGIRQELKRIEPSVNQLTEHGKYDYAITKESNDMLRITRIQC